MFQYKEIPSFLRRDGDALVFNQKDKEFIFYIPEIYFQRGNAITTGEYINLIGIMDYTIEDVKTKKNNGLTAFNFPTVFLTKPYTMEKVKGIKLTKNSDVADYRLLRYKQGDQIVVSVKVPQNINNVEEFYRLVNTGNLPNTIKYDKLHEYFLDSIKLNGSSYGVNIQLLGILVSKLARDPNDLSKVFRLSKTTDMTDYKFISIKDIARYIDPFASLTSENWDEAIVSANISKDHKNSPLEKLLID